VWDIDGSGAVQSADCIALIAAWGTDDAAADLDGNLTVGIADLLLLLSNWSSCLDCDPGWTMDCQGTCFPDDLVEAWLGDDSCDDGAYIPYEYGCTECPPGVPIYLNCAEFKCDYGDCNCP
jgi:hypothetical protein